MNIARITNPIAQLFKPTPPPKGTVTWMYRQVSLGSYLVWDAIGRVRNLSDGLDKSNKLAITLLNGAELWMLGTADGQGGLAPCVGALRLSIGRFQEFIGGTSVIGRYQAVFGVDRSGTPLIYKRSKLKATSMVFLMIAKTAEFSKWLDKIGLLPVKWAAEMDAAYLGGIASQIGATSLVRKFHMNTLSGTKNVFVVLSATYSILDTLTTLINAKKWDTHLLTKVCLGVTYDIGKIALTFWYYWFTMTWTCFAIALTTASAGMMKFLFESYTAPGGSPFLTHKA